MGKKEDLSELREQFEKEKENYVMPKEWEQEFFAIYEKKTRRNWGTLWITAAVILGMFLGIYADIQQQAISLLF